MVGRPCGKIDPQGSSEIQYYIGSYWKLRNSEVGRVEKELHQMYFSKGYALFQGEAR